MKNNSIDKLCRGAKEASRKLALLDSKTKNNILNKMGKSIEARSSYILNENEKDVIDAEKKGMSKALIDRLLLNERRIKSMGELFFEVAKLKDPIGVVLETRRRPNGLLIKKVRVPIGVILIIYESRPNVTADCAALCLKSGNALILRGSSAAIRSNLAIYKAINDAGLKAGLPQGAITMIKDANRSILDGLLKKKGEIDLVMPRGGESLIRYVAENSNLPVIKHYKGVCHTFVDKTSGLKMAEDICFNAKVQRPGVCNAMETLLVHEGIAAKFLPSMIRRYLNAGVEIRGSAAVRRIAKGVRIAKEEDWYTEYLGLTLSVKIVKDVDEAIRHIMKYGSFHSDAIITRDTRNAEKFLKEVDSACVYVNASTRFTDGGEFGKGAEIGISTDKIHARGPMGLEELTSYKYIIYGSGQIRK